MKDTSKNRTRDLAEVREANRNLAEKALNMRCLAYLSQVKASLLTATIYDINHSKKTLRIELDAKVKLEAELIEANKTRERLLQIMAHDLRAPFANLVGLSQGLAESYDKFDETQRKDFINMLHHLSVGTMELIDNLLEWTRTQNKKLKPQPNRLKLNTIFKEQVYLYDELARKKGVELVNLVPQGLEVTTDLNMLQTIIRNLISNAIKFSPPASRITVDGELVEAWVRLSVTDQGVGMSEPRIAELLSNGPFLSQPGTQAEKGCGLGLLLTQELCQLMGGKFRVTSIEGQGSCFIIELPQ
ncbi:MAG: hypothetical protein A2527_08210 [Candidatus Lambdaproteobacteria bacterium RIFOXYD2_FULL_50_16]|uniref:histidine kinase n=1 Tax=Candidatus Lambdaproteobacteria bacterium RIFOXYD2_FULL_50_16 TaxID=1817772 RepID=A0A1F6GAK8_9PROT|nr:MAG: hypothetical protein A2527_08210 [Candidatus Lambdaproteobacteria bacterium RIFOXYD2_FULL_50_16]